MVRNSKVLGLALVAALALCAVAASAAIAKFDSEAEVTTLHGAQSTTHQFTVSAGTITCSTATFTGTQTGAWNGSSYTAEDITINPTYEKCVGLGESHVNMNGCQYTLTAGETSEEGTRVGGEVHIICPESKQIEVTGTGFSGLCRVTVPAQTPTTNKLTYHNQGSGSTRAVNVEAAIGGIHYTQHGIFCPGNGFNSTRSFTNGTYTGNTLTKGTNAGGTQVGVWVT